MKEVITNSKSYIKIHSSLLEYDSDNLQWGIAKLYNEYENFDLNKLAEKIKFFVKTDFENVAKYDVVNGKNIKWKEILFNSFPWDDDFETTLDYLIDSPETINRRVAFILQKYNYIKDSLLVLKAIYNYNEPPEIKKTKISEVDELCYTNEPAVKAIIVSYLQSGKLFPPLTSGENTEKLFGYLFGVNWGSVGGALKNREKYKPEIQPDYMTNEPYDDISSSKATGRLPNMKAAQSVFILFDKCIPTENKEIKAKINAILKDINRKIMFLESKAAK